VAATTVDLIEQRALELGRRSPSPSEQSEAVGQLVDAAGADRPSLEEARNRLARRLHGNSSDSAAVGALGLLNRALVAVGWDDPYDWRVRWSQPFRRP